MTQYLKSQTITVTIFAFFVVLISAHVKAATPKPPGEVVWQIEEQFISLVPQDAPNSPKNDHPATISPSTLAEMLFVISVNEKKSRFSFGNRKADLNVPLFSEYEVDVLSGVLAEALQSATAEEDILFRIHGGKKQLGGISSRKTVNTGRAFWKKGRLNIIFGEVHGGDKTKWLYGQKQKDTYVRKFGSRTSVSDRVDVTFSLLPGIAQGSDLDDKVRSDWISIGPEAVTGKATAKQQSHSTTQQPATTTSSKPQAYTSQTLKQNLKELKTLRDEGLISEEIYQQKVQELINQSY